MTGVLIMYEAVSFNYSAFAAAAAAFSLKNWMR
jgi:hypothetical protein